MPSSSHGYPNRVSRPRHPSRRPGVTLLVGECVLRYFEHAQRYYVHADGSQTGECGTIRALLRPLVKMFGSLPVWELGRKRLKRVSEELIKLV